MGDHQTSRAAIPSGTVRVAVIQAASVLFDIDYLFVKEAEFQSVVVALRRAGHSVEGVLP